MNKILQICAKYIPRSQIFAQNYAQHISNIQMHMSLISQIYAKNMHQGPLPTQSSQMFVTLALVNRGAPALRTDEF